MLCLHKFFSTSTLSAIPTGTNLQMGMQELYNIDLESMSRLTFLYPSDDLLSAFNSSLFRKRTINLLQGLKQLL